MTMNEQKRKYSTGLTVYGTEIDLDALRYFISLTIPVEELSVTGDEGHAEVCCLTAEPWKVLEYCATVGEMDNIRIGKAQG